MTALEKVIEELPLELRQEVEDFARFLLIHRANAFNTSRRPKRLRLSWAGALSEHRHRFTAIELQKQSLEWWGI
jgi:hypothetical protein